MKEKDNGKLTDTIKDDLKNAIKERDKKRVSVLRMILNDLNNARIERGEDLSAEDELSVLSSCAKKRRESIREYKKGERNDLVKEEEEELDIVMSYLPNQLTEEEIEREVKGIIDELGAGGMEDMGKVMGKMMAKFRGRVDGKVVNRIVSGMLKG